MQLIKLVFDLSVFTFQVQQKQPQTFSLDRAPQLDLLKRRHKPNSTGFLK